MTTIKAKEEDVDLIIYGWKISQPTRAVMWLCSLAKIKYRFQFEDITKSRKYRKRFLKEINPIGRIPAMKDISSNFILYESAAIMIYICNKYKLEVFYPAHDLERRAKIDQYLHFHHENVRLLTTAYVGLIMRIDIKIIRFLTGTNIFERRELLKRALNIIEKRFLSEHIFIVDHRISIADILCYAELFQIEIWNLLDEENVGDIYGGKKWLMKNYPNIQKWMERMQMLEHHKEIHQPMQDLVNSGFITRRKKLIDQAIVEYHKNKVKVSKL